MKFTVPGLPCSKNAAYRKRHGSGGLALTPKAEEFMERVQAAAVNAGLQRPWFDGPGIIVITEAHFTRDADAGAVAALVQDALQGIAYTNDSQVLFAGGWKGDPAPENPRTEVSVVQLVFGASSLGLDVPPYAWRPDVEQRARDMRSILPSATREKINVRKLVKSARNYR